MPVSAGGHWAAAVGALGSVMWVAADGAVNGQAKVGRLNCGGELRCNHRTRSARRLQRVAPSALPERYTDRPVACPLIHEIEAMAGHAAPAPGALKPG